MSAIQLSKVPSNVSGNGEKRKRIGLEDNVEEIGVLKSVSLSSASPVAASTTDGESERIVIEAQHKHEHEQKQGMRHLYHERHAPILANDTRIETKLPTSPPASLSLQLPESEIATATCTRSNAACDLPSGPSGVFLSPAGASSASKDTPSSPSTNDSLFTTQGQQQENVLMGATGLALLGRLEQQFTSNVSSYQQPMAGAAAAVELTDGVPSRAQFSSNVLTIPRGPGLLSGRTVDATSYPFSSAIQQTALTRPAAQLISRLTSPAFSCGTLPQNHQSIFNQPFNYQELLTRTAGVSPYCMHSVPPTAATGHSSSLPPDFSTSYLSGLPLSMSSSSLLGPPVGESASSWLSASSEGAYSTGASVLKQQLEIYKAAEVKRILQELQPGKSDPTIEAKRLSLQREVERFHVGAKANQKHQDLGSSNNNNSSMLQSMVLVGGQESFPMVLHRVLAQLEINAQGWKIACFLRDGKSFQIRNHHLFEKEVLPVFFPKMKGYASFQRQLNLYDFKRVGGLGFDRKAYQHEMFLRDYPARSSEMKRRRLKGRRPRGPSSKSQTNIHSLDAGPIIEGDET